VPTSDKNGKSHGAFVAGCPTIRLNCCF